jgi:hypothetical protein
MITTHINLTPTKLSHLSRQIQFEIHVKFGLNLTEAGHNLNRDEDSRDLPYKM